MSQFWFKVYSPEHDETRILWMDVPRGDDIYIFKQLKDDVRNVFSLGKDYEFYFLHTDKDNDDVAIKKNYELLNYMFRMENNNKLKLTIATHKQKEPTQDTTPNSNDDSPAALSESFQSIMKHLELGMSSLQASVEKNAVSVATSTVDTVVKTAAETAASVYRSMHPLTSSFSEKPQFDVICDGCYTPIRGQRWRCETCDDFDLCSTCKSRVNHNQTHNFRHIKKETSFYPQENNAPEQNDTDSDESNPSQTIFICDYCDSDIVGIRHTCGACPDFDLCHSCFSIVKENHPEHIFVTRLVGAQAYKTKNVRPSKNKNAGPSVSPWKSYDQEIPVVHHIGVKCDNCDRDITGTRFKCGHCINYDLCETCEQVALSVHDSHHAFIKIRFPIQSITKKVILPRFVPLSEKTLETNREMESVSSSKSKLEEISVMTEMSEASSSSGSSNSVLISEKSPHVPPEPSIVKAPSTVTASPGIPVIIEPSLSACFVSDINIPDGTTIVPKKTFIKMWKIMNNGSTDWPVGTHLLFAGGSILRPHPVSRPDSFVVPVVSPKEETCITAELRAPDCSGEYSSYFCLCTPDGVRFGDMLWCSIKVDHDEEPGTITRTASAVDIMMNSSNSMIYPTISTASSFYELPAELESNDGYTDHDQCSVSTNDHTSIMTSNLSYTNSHVSSPAASELDIGERHRDSFFPVEVVENEEEERSPVITQEYQVISPAASVISSASISSDASAVSAINLASSTDAIPPQVIHSNMTEDNDSEDEFIMIESQENASEEKPHNNMKTNNNSNNNSLASSSHTVTPVQEIISDEVVYRTQLLKLHEMGFTNCDDLAISLLKSHKGRVEDVIAKLLYYP
ncbi:hypothetical protein EDC94DRAFT_620602 [Helicostylum pulchrum]|nr:hypothetical protein EDC94DRAFT_620602 [Helicostylum pulchrum]